MRLRYEAALGGKRAMIYSSKFGAERRCNRWEAKVFVLCCIYKYVLRMLVVCYFIILAAESFSDAFVGLLLFGDFSDSKV